jgi:endonuclease III
MSGRDGAGPAEATLVFEGPLDLPGTLTPLGVPLGDPTLRADARAVVRASRTPAGPATLLVEPSGPGRLRARAWGPGAAVALERAPALLGIDAPAPRDPWPRAPARVRSIARRAAGVRLARSESVLALLVPIVLEQLVSGRESSRAFAGLVRRYSAPAPGPFADLWLPLGAAELRAIPAAAFPAFGATPRQAATLLELARRASRVEEAATMDTEAASRRLRAFPGVGIWTAHSALLRGLGHPDAVPLGDYHLPHLVAWALGGERTADDARMLALLEPYRGQRGRLVRWIAHAVPPPARRGPRAALRPIDPDGWRLARGPS